MRTCLTQCVSCCFLPFFPRAILLPPSRLVERREHEPFEILSSIAAPALQARKVLTDLRGCTWIHSRICRPSRYSPRRHAPCSAIVEVRPVRLTCRIHLDLLCDSASWMAVARFCSSYRPFIKANGGDDVGGLQMTSLFVTGSHPLMQKIRSLASRLATCDTVVLIQGEHGTGKRELARHIHQQSPRGTGPFLSVDCASTPTEHLVDTVWRAHCGTIFLANVGALDGELQPLLREILDGKEVQRWGSRNGRPNVRLIASAEPELAPHAPCGDLFVRLCRVSLFLPPLRERRSDIPMLIRHLLDEHASSNDGPARCFADDTSVYLWQYDWPGNLRELAEVVCKSATSAEDGIIYPRFLPACVRASLRQGAPASLRASNSFEERRFLRAAGNNERTPFLLV